MKRASYLLLFALIVSACGDANLALINQVKRFEPEWLDLSDKVSFIDRNLRLTGVRYEEHFRELDRYLSGSSSDGGGDLNTLRSEYRTLVSNRDKIQQDFKSFKVRFLDQLTHFNTWENDLSTGDLDDGMARGDFLLLKRDEEKLDQEADKLYKRLIQNIEQHNSLSKRIAVRVNLYTNYDISPR